MLATLDGLMHSIAASQVVSLYPGNVHMNGEWRGMLSDSTILHALSLHKITLRIAAGNHDPASGVTRLWEINTAEAAEWQAEEQDAQG